MNRWLIVSLCLALGLASTACTERKRRAKVEASALIEKRVSKSPTTPEHKLSFRFGDKVELIGFDLDSERIAPGEPFTVTWHWQVDKPLKGGWRQFTHVLDERGVGRLNMDEQRELFGIYPSAEWKAGEYVRDRQTITLPRSFPGRGVRLAVGFWRDGERLPVTKGQHRNNSVIALSRAVQSAHAKPAAPPTLTARKRQADITLDGKLEEPDWQAAPWTAPFVNTLRGSAGAFPARAKVLFDQEAMYVAFEVQDDYLKADHREHDDHLWEQDTVEVMVDPDGDGKNYFELQVSPRNVHFDTRYDARRVPRPFGHVDWDPKLTSAVALRGELHDEGGDEGYTVEMRVPWTAFTHGQPAASPPEVGDTFAINFFVMDARPGGQRAVGWSPPLVGDFHTLDRFGKVRFGSEKSPTTTDKPSVTR